MTLSNAEAVAKRAYSLAQKHIETAIETSSPHLWLGNAFGLQELPPSIAKATATRKVSLWNTRVADLSALAALPHIKTLELWGTPVADLTPLADLKSLEALELSATAVTDLGPLSKISGLRYLDISNTKIADLTPLRGHSFMRKLRLVNTRVEDISPLQGLIWLEGLAISGSPISDITPLARLTNLAGLQLNRTKVTDLAPIAELTALATDSRTRIGGPFTSVDVGLYFYNAPIADPYIATLKNTFNVRARTYAVLNRVREQRGLKPLDVPASSAIERKSFDFSALPRQLPQDSFGAVFEAAEETLVMAPSGNETDELVAAQPITQQLHSALKSKVARLTDRAGRLSNQQGWEDLPVCAGRLSDALGDNAADTARQIGAVWAESVTLGSFLEQDQRVRKDDAGWVEPLEPEMLRSLADVVETLGPWLRRFPTARLLDDDSATYRHADDPTASASAVLAGARKVELIISEDGEIIDAALNAAERGSAQAKKANNWGQVSVRNISFAAIGLIAAGYAAHLGEDIAEQSVLADKAQRFVLEREADLLEFLENLPADIRAAVTSLIEHSRRNEDTD